MARPPHSRTRPPAPKERPATLAVSAPPYAAPAPPARASRWADDVGAVVFVVLVLLGLLAAARAFVVM